MPRSPDDKYDPWGQEWDQPSEREQAYYSDLKERFGRGAADAYRRIRDAADRPSPHYCEVCGSDLAKRATCPACGDDE